MTIEHLVQTLISRFGWQLESHRPEAVERALLARTLKLGASSSEVYLRDLKPHGTEFNLLLEELVVPESWFYRERETLSFLLEQLTAQSYCQTDPLRILCVPCARGEEPSSLAMMLQQAGWSASRRTLEAVDLSQAAIDSALLGRYRGHSFRGNLMGFRSEFFKEIVDQDEEQQSQAPKTNLWELSESIRNSIEYSVQNVFELPDRYTSYDVILCRHLLIYLTASARDRLFEIVAERLKPNGILVVAACEFALPPLHRFTPISREGIVLFRNQPFPASPTAGADRRHLTRPSLLKSPPSQPLHSNSSKDRPSLSSPTRLDRSSRTQPISVNSQTAPTDATGSLERAKAEADLGRLHSALELCQTAIASKPTAEAYCLQGVVQGALNDQSASEASFRKALYLDPDNKEALTQVALIKEAAGDVEGAKRLRERLNR